MGPDEPTTVTVLSAVSGSDANGSTEPASTGGPQAPRRGPIALLGLAVVALALLLIGTGRGSTPEAAPSEPTPATSDAPPPSIRIREVAPIRAPSGPVFDREVGLVVVVGGLDHELHLIDLDTGEVSALELSGLPALVEDGFVVVQDRQGDWTMVELATGAVAPVAVAPDVDRFDAAVPAEGEGVWFRHATVEDDEARVTGRVWTRVLPRSGAVVEQVTLPLGARVVSDLGGRPLRGPEIIGSDAGQVFALTDGGSFDHLLDGHLVAAGDDLLLVARCTPTLCTHQWLDRSPLEVRSDLVPPEVPLGGAVVRDDGVLVAETPTWLGSAVKVVDIPTNQAIATGSPSGLLRTWVSPSGRFVAVPGFNALLITDIEGNRTATIDRLLIDDRIQLAWGRS